MHISYESGELEDPAYPGNNVECVVRELLALLRLWCFKSSPSALGRFCDLSEVHVVLDNRRYPGMVLKKKTVDIMDAPDQPANLTIHFESGTPVRVVNAQDGVDVTGPLELFSYLNEVRSCWTCWILVFGLVPSCALRKLSCVVACLGCGCCRSPALMVAAASISSRTDTSE